ncbi:hypothetical protein BDD12DRAFT_855550 [Trichophaea hybrida]|nr:hypothetical protein BDD12DRAFT_855550 [Trichophaea hybrida]
MSNQSTPQPQTSCPIYTSPLTNHHNICFLFPCNHQFHLPCFQTKARGLSPYKCPTCNAQVKTIEKGDGTKWQVEVFFPARTTEREARRYLEESVIPEEWVAVIIEGLGNPEGAGWTTLEKK